jgi:DNA-directed RNA polymerase subunit RPC12/RpoP
MARRPKPPGSTTKGGWGAKHQALRAEYVKRMGAGEQFMCWRCGGPVDPRAFDLGHDDHDRSLYRGPEHRGRECPQGGNRATYKRRVTQLRRWQL